jgi:hypothetical protein
LEDNLAGLVQLRLLRLGLLTQPKSKLRPGQVWRFKTPPDQPNARLTILHGESGGKLGTLVHVALSGVSYGDRQTQIQHLPFAESAFERSVTTLERKSGPIPDYAEGYRLWREAFDAGKGGVFTATIAEVFEAVTGVAWDLQGVRQNSSNCHVPADFRQTYM